MNTRKYHKLSCGPKTKKKKNTCYKKKDLLILRNAWNIRNPQQKIVSTQPRIIWKQLKNYMQYVCEHERCWLSNLLQNTDIQSPMYHRFAPLRPSTWDINPYEWLSNHDIKKVMNQYEYEYPRFTFIGPSPINYDDINKEGRCVWEELCSFSLSKYLSKKDHIGIVFNTDIHTGPGKHWVSLFINLKEKYIYYFDSGNELIPSYIKSLIKDIKKQGKKHNMTIRFIRNRIVHQKGNSECGMYCLYFIISLLTGKKPSYFEKRISDEKVFSLRNEYFNKT